MSYKTSEIINLWNKLRKGQITQKQFDEQIKVKL
jgi:hypothetical protein